MLLSLGLPLHVLLPHGALGGGSNLRSFHHLLNHLPGPRRYHEVPQGIPRGVRVYTF
jgi:hypothetical protein